ncbi:MAG: RDD family protein [Gammaproteobacteria bacterium]|nr:RDD family protein [Gammaproteobacteria bacterium]MBL6998722.1 RDD family protein [Gammaproteobacteria bacterium]
MNHKILLQCPPASLIKQMIAMVYDSLLIISILFIATAILLPFNQGEAINNQFYTFYLFIIIFIFYSWFWNISGQTLGMKVWKIRIINENGFNPSWPVCFLRLCFALISIGCFGLGYWWRLFKPYTWHDHFSQTRIIDVAKIALEKK